MDDLKHIPLRATGETVLNLYKKLGETPRERLERLRSEKPYFAHDSLSYAGRLDPMAEGVLLCLVGPANKHRDEYLNLSKEYTLDVLFGFSTDTYDILGRVMDGGDPSGIESRSVTRALNEFRGALEQRYPPFSSKTVEGRALFEWARAGALESLMLPKREVTIYDISLKEMYKVDEPMLIDYIMSSVEQVEGDFRQEEIARLWRRRLKEDGDRKFPAATVHVSCSSGTYVRSIAHELGNHLGIPALALHILRTKVGEYDIANSLR
jgi:tRNA pseudouridine55 synthase